MLYTCLAVIGRLGIIMIIVMYMPTRFKAWIGAHRGSKLPVNISYLLTVLTRTIRKTFELDHDDSRADGA